MPITLISIMIINIISNIIREEVKVQDGRKCRTLKWHNELCGRESTVPVLDQRGGGFRQHMWEQGKWQFLRGAEMRSVASWVP